MKFLILLLLLPFFTFLGYWVHRFFHNPISGIFYKKHMNHHTIQYPPNDFFSDKYRYAGKDNSVVLFTIAFSPLAILLAAAMIKGWIGIFFGLAILAEMIGIAVLNDNMHDNFHLNYSFWKKFPFFDRLIKLHQIHHDDMSKNFGIFSFLWDRLFKTYKD